MVVYYLQLFLVALDHHFEVRGRSRQQPLLDRGGLLVQVADVARGRDVVVEWGHVAERHQVVEAEADAQQGRHVHGRRSYSSDEAPAYSVLVVRVHFSL